jgi:hypothetical protein
VVAVTIKETSALQLLAYLAAASLVRWSDVRWWRVTGAYLLLLIFCTLPMHFVESDNLHAFTVWSDGFHPMRIFGIILHTGAQLVFLLSAAGVALLACGAARFVSFRWRSALAWLLLLLVIVGAPVLRYYSHFEAIIFSDGPWTIFQVCLLAGGLLVALSGSSSLTKAEKTALLTVGLTWLGYAAAPVVLRFARADVSARIFAACVPILHALVFRELFALWRGRSRALSAAFGVLFALFVLSSAFNTVSFHRVRLSVELEAKKGLSSDFRMAEPALINTNAVQLMSVEQLRALGASRLGPEAWIQTTSSQPDAGMTVDQFAEAGGILADRGQDVYLYIQTARSSMSPYANQIFAGDFSWADDWLPESDDDLFAGYQRMIYETETDIELLFIREGHSLVRVRADYWQLPLSWNEVPRRMWLGLPLIEDYRYVARVYRIPARQPGWHPPGGRSRHRRGAAP